MGTQSSREERVSTLPVDDSSDIQRKAIDLVGQVGDQYDAGRDEVLKKTRLTENSNIPTETRNLSSCSLIKGETANSDTLIKILNIDNQLVLSLLFNMTTTSRDGTYNAVFNSRQWNNSRTRILFYRRIFKERSLPLQPKYTSLKREPLQPATTHIITSVLSGVEVLIVLQAPGELPMRDIDGHLRTLYISLHQDKKLADDDTSLKYLDQLKIIAAYSNMANLVSRSNMSSAYEQIHQSITVQSQPPLLYKLRPIASIYPKANRIYYDINHGIIHTVQSDLLTLRSLLDEARLLFTDPNKHELHEQFEKVQQRHNDIQKLLTTLISAIRRGKKDDLELVRSFNRPDYLQLIHDLEKLINETPCSTDFNEKSDSSLQHESLPNSTAVTDLNVLLLGETGVGKSTFINALANYMKFRSLEKARVGEPIVLMPTSFLITRGKDFKETTIKFGTPDPNEAHNDRGQSITQQCRSYKIPIDNCTQLNIIDTPGIGDTRGLLMDKMNMHNILSFIENIDHLNAICILLKPNVQRLHVYFRLCLSQLLDFLGPNACKNIIFCFTNTRSTFYAPGDTAPLVDAMLKKLPGNRIPFYRLNTFCFDSESFRYLIATQQGIPFEEISETRISRDR